MRRMLPLSLVLVLTSALAADLPPRELIRRLGSPDRVVREEAARTLEERGAEALPALRSALEAAKDPEAREQFADLMTRVEARSFDRPTMVALDVDDQPLGEVVQALATRSGFSLSLDDPALAGRRVTVRAPGTLPFWEAVDRLGRAGHVRHDPGPGDDAIARDRRAPTIRLVAGDPPAFSAYFGPLRIHLFATHRHRDLNFEADGVSRVPQRNATVTALVQAFAEPGRFLNPNGLPRLEAVDERGRAIFPQPVGGGEQPERGGNSWLIPGRISLLQWHVLLGLPDLSVRSPLKLRGVLPVVISTRRPDPLVIPLVGAAGKTFRQGPRVVRIEKVSGQGEGTTAVELYLSEDAIPADRTRVSAGPETDYIGDFLPNRIEFEDALGQPLNWLHLGSPVASTANDEILVRTFVSGVAPPARLRVYRLHRLATEIPFEFGEVPSP
jgi:hypothetical protein